MRFLAAARNDDHQSVARASPSVGRNVERVWGSAARRQIRDAASPNSIRRDWLPPASSLATGASAAWEATPIGILCLKPTEKTVFSWTPPTAPGLPFFPLGRS